MSCYIRLSKGTICWLLKENIIHYCYERYKLVKDYMISFFLVFKDYLKRTVLEMPLDCDLSDSSFPSVQLALIIVAAVI